MTPEAKEILLLIEKELIQNEGARFTQVLYNLCINQPEKIFYFRDNYNDSDFEVLLKIKGRKRIESEKLEESKFDYKSQIILNRIQTPDGTILTSWFDHDYVCHKDKNGKTYCIDGGLSHLSRWGDIEDYKELSVSEKHPFKIIRQALHRGSKGKDNKGDFTWTPLCEMDDEWIKNSITYNKEKGLDKGYANKFYKKELVYRKRNNITIKSNDSKKKANTTNSK